MSSFNRARFMIVCYIGQAIWIATFALVFFHATKLFSGWVWIVMYTAGLWGIPLVLGTISMWRIDQHFKR